MSALVGGDAQESSHATCCFVCWRAFITPFYVCALFNPRYPGVHQSGSGSGQHQRGGRRTLPRHEWERRALWVGESKKRRGNKKNLLSFTIPPSSGSPGSHSQAQYLIHTTCFAEYTTLQPFSEDKALFFFSFLQYPPGELLEIRFFFSGEFRDSSLSGFPYMKDGKNHSKTKQVSF